MEDRQVAVWRRNAALVSGEPCTTDAFGRILCLPSLEFGACLCAPLDFKGNLPAAAAGEDVGNPSVSAYLGLRVPSNRARSLHDDVLDEQVLAGLLWMAGTVTPTSVCEVPHA